MADAIDPDELLLETRRFAVVRRQERCAESQWFVQR